MPEMQYSDHQELISQIFSRNSERNIFQSFLNSVGEEGISVTDRLYEAAKTEARKVCLPNGSKVTNKDEIIEATVRRYKQRRGLSGMTSYDEMILDLIGAENNARELVEKIKRGKGNLDLLPANFPGMRKKAEILFHGKVSADIDERDSFNYETEKRYASILREYAKDLFFAVNHGAGEKALDFVRLMYELNRIKTSEPINSGNFRKLILNALTCGQPLEMVHIKSLRFTYPGGANLKVLTDTSSVEQPGFPGEIRRYPSEEVIFERLNFLRGILARFGIQTILTVIVSDHDLDFCFPAGQDLVPKEDVEEAREAVKNYITNLSRLHPEIECVKLFSTYLTEKGLGGEFAQAFASQVRECERGGGSYLSEKIIEMRVNEQFEHYRQMFGFYSRELARHTTIHNLSSILALSVLFSSFSTTPLLVIDPRGLEDKLIGALRPDSVVKFFTKLKDPVEIKRC